jgi:hypothetical protein
MKYLSSAIDTHSSAFNLATDNASLVRQKLEMFMGLVRRVDESNTETKNILKDILKAIDEKDAIIKRQMAKIAEYESAPGEFSFSFYRSCY